MQLVIGNKKTSSWSLRPWLLMKHFGIAFEEITIALYKPTTAQDIENYTPSQKVPVLIDDNLTIWDSLAIFEYLNEKYPDKKMWPQSKEQRAFARSICCEMHSGFSTMREIMSHNVKEHFPDFDYSAAAKDVARIVEIWHDCLEKSGGPYLFGSQFTIADAMFAPVVNRFITYDVKCNTETIQYIKTIRALPSHQEWILAGAKEA